METEPAPPTSPRFGIAFGSNQGDRLANLTRAKALLLERAGGSEELLCSPVYETSPVDCEPDSTSFYNAVVEFASPLAPETMWSLCLKIEAILGRPTRRPKNAPRSIDLDLLYAGDRAIETADLVLPHPRVNERRFVLEPLVAIRPDLILPGSSATASELLAQLESSEPPLTLITEDW
jgi:2-amino-4-hydroxy-6-hydroxymethyldihydropteridine diphosphokinase